VDPEDGVRIFLRIIRKISTRQQDVTSKKAVIFSSNSFDTAVISFGPLDRGFL
jgi:hypothetical protein